MWGSCRQRLLHCVMFDVAFPRRGGWQGDIMFKFSFNSSIKSVVLEMYIVVSDTMCKKTVSLSW